MHRLVPAVTDMVEASADAMETVLLKFDSNEDCIFNPFDRLILEIMHNDPLTKLFHNWIITDLFQLKYAPKRNCVELVSKYGIR